MNGGAVRHNTLASAIVFFYTFRVLPPKRLRKKRPANDDVGAAPRVIAMEREVRRATNTSLEAEMIAVLRMGFYLLGFREMPSVDRSAVRILRRRRA
jgi:hypothetical protein